MCKKSDIGGLWVIAKALLVLVGSGSFEVLLISRINLNFSFFKSQAAWSERDRGQKKTEGRRLPYAPPLHHPTCDEMSAAQEGPAADSKAVATTTSSSSSAAAVAAEANDQLFKADEAAVREIKKAHPWLTDYRYFNKVKVSTTAAISMLQHAVQGVEKGLAKGFAPIEIMGLMAGRPSTDPKEPRTIVITEIFPLSVEGTETRVVADDAAVQVSMVTMTETLESLRGNKERLIGWYHSHPFDVQEMPNYFLSATDVSTQWMWQNQSERAHGAEKEADIWLAVVVDPLRSVVKGRPEMGSFRCFPPSYSPPANIAPDGETVVDKREMERRWGSAVSRWVWDVLPLLSTDPISTKLLSPRARPTADTTCSRRSTSCPPRQGR